MSNMTNQFKIPFIILLILQFATCKSITTNAKTSENAVEPIVRQQFNVAANQNAANEATTLNNNKPTEPPTIPTNPVTIIPANGTDGAKRNERTVYHLRVSENPSQVMENFRNKLKSARTHLQEVGRKTIQPKYIITPNLSGQQKNQENVNLKATHVPITMPINVKRDQNTQVVPDLESNTGFNQLIIAPKQPTTTDNKPQIQIPNKEDNTTPKTESPNDTVASPLDCSSEIASSDPTVGEAKENEELDHLLHMREEISKLRNIMQGIKEKQAKDKIKSDFAKHPNLTEDQHEELSHFGKQIESMPRESTEKIAKDVSNLKDIVQKFTKRMEVNKLRDENYDKLQEKIKTQQEEIEMLRKQMKIPQSKPSQILTPIPVTEELSEERKRLLDELKHLQDSLSDITLKENGGSILRSSNLEQKEDPTLKQNHEMETLLDLFHTITKPTNPKLMASKLDKLERDLDDLDVPKPPKRQDSILEKLKEDLKKLKVPKVPIAKVNLKSQTKEVEEGLNEKPTVEEKLTELEKQIKEMSGAETRGDNPIEKELNELQKKIDELSPNKSNPDQSEAASKTNPSIQDLLSNLLNNPNSDHSKIAPNFVVPESHSGHPPIFALPFCLQTQPESHPYPGKIPSTNQFSNNPKPAPVFEQEADFGPNPSCNCEIFKPLNNIAPLPYPGPGQPLNYPPAGPTSNVHRGDIHSGPINDHYPPIKSQDSYNAASQSNYNIPVQKYENTQSNYNDHGPIKHQYQPMKDQYQPIKDQYQPIKDQYQPVHQYQPIKPQESLVYNGGSSSKPVQKYENAQPNYNQQSGSISNLHGINTDVNYQPNYNGGSGNKPNYNIYDMNIVAKKDLVPYQSVDSNPNLNHQYAQSISYSGDSNNKNPISLYSTNEKSFYVKPVINHDNYKSIYDKYNNNPVNVEQEIQKLGDVLEGLNAKINKYPHHAAGQYRKKRAIENYEDPNLADVQQRLNFLREQVKKFEANPDYRNDSQTGFDSAIRAADYYSQNSDQYDKKGYKVKKVHKFDKLFIKVLKFILHKLEISAPHIIESLFDGDSFTYEYDVDNYGSNYRSAGYNGGGSGQNVFDGLSSGFQGFPGLLGFIPTIIFKILSNFSFFLNILKRNTFFKNFLVPGALILVVDGIMAILIWWSSTDIAQNAISFVPNNQNYNNPSLTTYNSPYSNNINQYS